jgi:hypothetical protein
MAGNQASAIFEFASHSSFHALRWRRGAHAITVRSTGLTERRRKLLQVPCRNTRYQRTDARSNFTPAEHQSSLQMSVAMSCFMAWQIDIATGGVKMQVRLERGCPTSRQGTRPRCCMAQNLPNIRYSCLPAIGLVDQGLAPQTTAFRYASRQRCCPAIAIATSPRMHACSRAQNFLAPPARHDREAFSDTLGHEHLLLVRAGKHNPRSGCYR